MKTITAIIILATVVCNVHGSSYGTNYYYYFTSSRGSEILESDGEICVTTQFYDFSRNRPLSTDQYITMEVRPNSASYPELTAESDGNK